MANFFISSKQVENEKLIIKGSDVHHISNVLRLKRGSTVNVFDEQGKGYRARLERVGKEQVECMPVEEIAGSEPPLRLTLVQGLPKSDKMEMIIQKCTEIGVTHIIPLCSERSVLKLLPDRVRQRIARWRRIALEAAKQCGRGKVPQVEEPVDLAGVLSKLPPDALGLMFWENEHEVFLKRIINEAKTDNVFLFIGPEGGFSSREVALARKHNVTTVSLGSRILRTETAGLVAAAMILYRLGDLGGAL